MASERNQTQDFSDTTDYDRSHLGVKGPAFFVIYFPVIVHSNKVNRIFVLFFSCELASVICGVHLCFRARPSVYVQLRGSNEECYGFTIPLCHWHFPWVKLAPHIFGRHHWLHASYSWACTNTFTLRRGKLLSSSYWLYGN